MEPDVYVVPIGSDARPPRAVDALSSPSFIIKDGDTYWVSLAVIGYRAVDAVTGVEHAGCDHIASLFAAGEGAGLEAVVRSPPGNPDFLSDQSTDQSTTPKPPTS